MCIYWTNIGFVCAHNFDSTKYSPCFIDNVYLLEILNTYFSVGFGNPSVIISLNACMHTQATALLWFTADALRTSVGDLFSSEGCTGTPTAR